MNKTRYKSCHLNLQLKRKLANTVYLASPRTKVWVQAFGIHDIHQRIQVPTMEDSLYLIRLWIGGWGFPYIGRIHTAYIGEDSSILGTWTCWWLHESPKKKQFFDWFFDWQSKEIQRRSKCCSCRFSIFWISTPQCQIVSTNAGMFNWGIFFANFVA